jgi:glycosyltransferase involved in cell wall biosynthesis
MPQKIAILTATFPPYRGGMGRLAELDARQLTALGYEVHVFTPRPRRPAERPDADYFVHELWPWFRFGNAAFVPEAAGVIGDFPLVFLHYPFFGGAELVSWVKRLIGGPKLALVYHMDVVGRGPFGVFFRWHRRLCLPAIMGASDRIIATSFDYLMRSDIAGVFRRQEDRFRELPPSVDPGRFAPGGKPTRLLARYGLDITDRVVLFVGGLDRAHYFKGIPLLLQALTTKELSSTKAVIVGEGDLRPEYEALAAKLGLACRVVFTGGVDDAELPDHYRLGDVFVFPSVDKSEAFGVAALEALACGLPVVASDLPGVRTIVRHGETGFCVPPGSVSAMVSRLDQLLDDEVMRQRFGMTARKMVEEEYADSVRLRRLGQIAAELLAGLRTDRHT